MCVCLLLCVCVCVCVCVCTTHPPAVQPVFSSQAVVPCCCILSASILAYFMGCHMRKAAPKHALKVASGSTTPTSVPAICVKTHTHTRTHTHTHANSV